MLNHDRLFKELLTEFFGDFIDLFLPQMAAYLDRASLVFLDKEIFTDVTAGETHEADLVVCARFRGEESFFLVHLEHQAQAQPDFGRRMFRYFARLYERHAVPVYPVALFSHSSVAPEPDHCEVAFPDFTVLRFQYRVIQLARMNWLDYLRQPNPVASALMVKMGMAPEERPRAKLECLRLLATLQLNPARTRLISGFIDTYLRLNARETLLFREASHTLEPEEQSKVMELTTSWKEEGIIEGLERGRNEGLERGRSEGKREEIQRTVFRLLRRRVGDIPAALAPQIEALPSEQMENLAEALLDFSSPADLEKWLVGVGTSS